MQFPNFINPVALHEFENLPTNHISCPSQKPGYIYVKKYIICDSHDRIPELESPYNYTIYSLPNSSSTSSSFNDKIENIVHIKCISAIIPKFSNVYPYLILTIQENGTIYSSLYASNELARKAFGILVPKTYSGISNDKFVTCDVSTTKTYNPPLASLKSLTIRIHTPSTLLFDHSPVTDENGDPVTDENDDVIPIGYIKIESEICPSSIMTDFDFIDLKSEKRETLLVLEITCQVLDSSNVLHHTYIN
jgi:hypothetical protein